MMKHQPHKKRRYLVICILLFFLTAAFIFSNSLLSVPQSRAISKIVQDKITPFLELFVGTGNVTNHLVRKIAHFVEFSVLGFELSILFRRYPVLPFLVGLLISAGDETIQIFSNRGAQVRDVWLDFIGVCFGILVGFIVLCLFRMLRAPRNLTVNEREGDP